MFRTFAHNCIAHPLAGVAWACGLDRVGDWFHSWFQPIDVAAAISEFALTRALAIAEIQIAHQRALLAALVDEGR